MKIFWSWQSDHEGKISHYLVRDALQLAIANLRVPEDIEEPSEAEPRAILATAIAQAPRLVIEHANMKKQQIRRAVIREWMGLPRDKRETEEQTAAFVARTTAP